MKIFKHGLQIFGALEKSLKNKIKKSNSKSLWYTEFLLRSQIRGVMLRTKRRHIVSLKIFEHVLRVFGPEKN